MLEPSPYSPLSSSIFSHAGDKSERTRRPSYTSYPSRKLPSLTKSAAGLITDTFHGIFRIINMIIPNIIFYNVSHCDFRYLDAVDSYTRISPLHRTRDCWHFQTLTPCHRSRFSGFGFAYHKAFYYSRLSTATFTCDNFSTIAFLSPTGIQLIFHNTSRGPVSRSILLSSPPSLTSLFLSTDIASVLH